MKKFVNFAFILFLLIGIFQIPTPVNAQNDDNRYYFIINGRKIGRKHDYKKEEFSINSAWYGKTTYKFEDGTEEKFKEMNIPSAAVKIKNSAFASCTNLEKVTLNKGLEEIGPYAFSGCTNLKSINIPEGVKTIGRGAFEKCTKLEKIIIPNSVEKIDASAFEDCISLKSVTLSNNITDIESFLFSGCRNLKSVNIPNGVKSIGYNSFYCCSSLTQIYIPNGVRFIGVGAFAYTGLTSIKIPSSVKTISHNIKYNNQSYAFEGIDTVYYNGPAKHYGTNWGAKQVLRY